MRKIALLLLTASACLANYPSQVSVLLAVGGKTVQITDDGPGGSTITESWGLSGSQRLRITFSPIDVPPPAGTVYTTCADPCPVNIHRDWGKQSVWVERVDSGGSPFNPPKISAREYLPMVVPAPAAPGFWTFPIEVIGQNYYQEGVQWVNPGTVRTNIRLRMTLNHVGCSIAPYDTKASFQVNGGAATANDGNWIAVSNSTATSLDKNNRFGVGSAAEGDWDVIDGPIPQAGIGGTPDTVIVSVPVPDNLVTASSTNTVSFRSFCPDGKTSGYRVLDFNFEDTSTLKTITQFVVSSNVSTSTSSVAHGWASNDWINIYFAPGIRGRFNGSRQITSTGASTFTFATCGVNPTLLNCTSPNGTYVVPTSQNSAAMATQPVAHGIRQIIPQSAFSYEDPSTWTAPPGGDPTNGMALWLSATLVNPNLPYLNNAITATCADCHTVSGFDLKYFNFSNESIEQRSIFHGLTYQQGKDIAAFIRGVSVTVPSISRAWTPLNQPCPTVDSQTVNAWAAGGGLPCELEYGTDGKEYMDASSFALWDATARMKAHEIPLMWQMPSWNQLLPAIHPKDYFPAASPAFPSSDVYTTYLNFRANVTPNSFSSYKAWAIAQSGGAPGSYSPLNYLDLVTWENPLRPPNSGVITDIGAWVAPSNFKAGYHSIIQWAAVKTWELEHEFGLETMCSQVYTDLYGAATSPAGYLDRCWYSGVPFNVAFHKNFAGTYRNTENDANTSFYYQSNQMYMWQSIINDGNLHQTGDFTMDIPYTWAFVNGAGQYFPPSYLMFTNAVQPTQASWDLNLTPLPPQQETFTTNGVNPYFLAAISMRFMFGFDDLSSRVNAYNHYLDTFAQATTKGTTPQWQTWLIDVAPAQNCNASGALSGLTSGNLCGAVAGMIPIFQFLGANQAKIDAIKTWAAAVFNTHNFDQDAAASASGVVSISSAVLTWTSGDKFDNFAINDPAGIQSRIYIAGDWFPIIAVPSNTSLTVGQSVHATYPPNGAGQAYARCVNEQPGGGSVNNPTWPSCGNL